MSEISADPQKRPYGVKGVPHRVENGQKFLMKIDIKFNISSNSDKKNGARIPEDCLGSKFMIPKILGSAEISTARSVFLKFWSCGSKNFKKWPNLKMVKNHHFSTFDAFFVVLLQTCPCCPNLPIFVSQKFLHHHGTPLENWKKCKNWNVLIFT